MSNGTNALVGARSHELAQQPSSCLGFNLKHEVDCMVWIDPNPIVKRVVSHHGLAICIKMCLKAKEDLWKFKYFTMQKHNLQQKSSKRNQIPSRYYNSTTNLKFRHKPKYHLSKILIIKVDLLLLPSWGQNPLSYYTL